MGHVLYAAGDTVGAAAKYPAALAIDPRNTRALYNLGVIAHFDGDLETSRTWHQQALSVEPDFVRACCNCGLVLRDLDDVVTQLKRVIEMKREHAGAFPSAVAPMRPSRCWNTPI